jgi:hypothetical protein
MERVMAEECKLLVDLAVEVRQSLARSYSNAACDDHFSASRSSHEFTSALFAAAEATANSTPTSCQRYSPVSLHLLLFGHLASPTPIRTGAYWISCAASTQAELHTLPPTPFPSCALKILHTILRIFEF